MIVYSHMRWIAVAAICLFVSSSARADWGARRDPFDPSVVRRYKAILAHDPHDADALRQLVVMYQRYRSVAKLEGEYREQLANGDDWSTLVVLARLPRPRTESLVLWKRAVTANPDDGRTWLALGDALGTDAGAARDAYSHAAKLVSERRQKQAALLKLIGAAQIVGDAQAVDASFAALIELSPKDGTLWLDRGNAQLAAKKYADARTSFATAESLLRTDPERQLTAMMNQGLALDAMGHSDEAVEQFEHTLDKVPRGYYLGNELIIRIIDIERRRKNLGGALARLEKRWPENRRGYVEWSMLGDLYKETQQTGKAIDAYKRAVAKAPTEVATQRKLITLLDEVDAAEALAQHEAAARVAPGDADLQLELAKRYHADQPAKAFATLEALARRMSKNINVRSSIATLYEQWNELARAILEYEAIASLEPSDPEHVIVLGEAYWRADNQQKARVKWTKLDRIGTAEAFLRHGEVLAVHELWEEAALAYSRSIALDGTNPDAWYGRARALDASSHFSDALDDARRAVALTGTALYGDGLRNRQMLIRALGHAYADGDREDLRNAVARWRFAFEHGDAAAGYLLVAHHQRLGTPQQHDVLVKLYKLVPGDDALGIVVARSYVRRHEFARARQVLEGIEQRTPSRTDEMRALIAQVEEEQERAEIEVRWEEEGRSRSHPQGKAPDLVGRHRVGMRLEIGGDVHDASGALLGLGMYYTRPLARGTSLAWRLDWTKRDDQMEEVNAIAFSGGVTTRLYDARKFELAVGLAPRVEVRWSSAGDNSQFDRGAIAGDATLELIPRALPATLGLRFDQALTDSVRSSSLFLELGFELR